MVFKELPVEIYLQRNRCFFEELGIYPLSKINWVFVKLILGNNFSPIFSMQHHPF